MEIGLCFSAVPGCCGVDHLVMSGPKRSQCISCAYQDNGCDGLSLEVYAEAMLAAGHTILDGEAPALAPESALRAVRSYAMQCPPFMDATGAREWDCSLWLSALLSCAAGRAIVGVEPPDTVLELGAGAGDLALRLASDAGFAAALQLYTATDVEGRVVRLQVHGTAHAQSTPCTCTACTACTACTTSPHVQERIAARGLGAVLRASALAWGAAVEAEHALVLVCDALFWKGEMEEADDTLAPLADTIASACRGRRTTCVLAHRERDRGREAAFYAMCRARGLALAPCSAAAQAYAPREKEQQDPGCRGRLCLVRICDAVAETGDTSQPSATTITAQST